VTAAQYAHITNDLFVITMLLVAIFAVSVIALVITASKP
jgi:hypothetical protein